jgi:predicted anti-sigma-YlaC factor YlaD
MAEGISAYLETETLETHAPTNGGAALVSLDRKSVEAHLRTCTYCRASLEKARGRRRSTSPARASAPPERVWENIEETLRREGVIRRSAD